MNSKVTIKVDESLTWYSKYFGARSRTFELGVCPLTLDGHEILSLVENKKDVTAYITFGPVHLRITRKEIEDLIPEEERFQQSIW